METSSGRPDPDSREFGWESYEEIVKDVYEALGRADGVVVECWGRRCTVEVAVGVRRQIDVLTIHSDGENAYRTAISCKWWSDRVDVAHVSDFSMIVQDAQVAKGVIVSKNGFTAPAVALARAKNLGLVELRKPADADWDGCITDVCGEITYLPSPEYRYGLRLTRPRPEWIESTEKLSAVLCASPPERIIISGPDGKNQTLWEHVFAATQDAVDGVELEIEFSGGTVMTTPDEPESLANGATILGLRVTVTVPPPWKHEINVRAADCVYMIMYSLFDGRRFNITTDEAIIEVM